MTSPAPLDAPLESTMTVPPPAPSPAPAPMPYAAPMAPAGHPVGRFGPAGEQRGPWAVWLLPLVTFGVYYLVWYYKINKELAEFAPGVVDVKPGRAVLALFVPIANLVSLANTAGRIRDAAAMAGVPVEISGGMTVLSAFWFSSQTRYLQRRLNTLWGGLDAS